MAFGLVPFLVPFGLHLLDHQGVVISVSVFSTARVGLYYIAPSDHSLPAPGRIQPGREGWLTLLFPTPTPDTLFKAQLGAKSEWLEPETRESCDNPAVIALFTKVARQLRRRLPLGTIVAGRSGTRNVTTIHCSAGMKPWVRDGKLLRQAGVANVEFYPGDPV